MRTEFYMYLCMKRCIGFQGAVVFKKKNQIFSRFPIVKMNANYAEIYGVGNLEADFQQVPHAQCF